MDLGLDDFKFLNHLEFPFRSSDRRETRDEANRPAGIRREADLSRVRVSQSHVRVVQGRRGHQQLRLGQVRSQPIKSSSHFYNGLKIQSCGFIYTNLTTCQSGSGSNQTDFFDEYYACFAPSCTAKHLFLCERKLVELHLLERPA